MAARRCGTCGINWPTEKTSEGQEFKRCPQCATETIWRASEDPDPAEVFRVLYLLHEEERQRRGDPSPESLGAIEASQQIARERGAVEELLESASGAAGV